MRSKVNYDKVVYFIFPSTYGLGVEFSVNIIYIISNLWFVLSSSKRFLEFVFRKFFLSHWIHSKLDSINSSFFSENVVNYKFNGNGVILDPRDSLNDSIYCYINSNLQSLVACPPLIDLLRKMSRNLKMDNKESIPTIEKMQMALKDHDFF